MMIDIISRSLARLQHSRAGVGQVSGTTRGAAAVLAAAVAATVAMLASGSASAIDTTPVLPDLVADPPGTSIKPEVYVDSQGGRLLLRFDGFVHNAGQGALELVGSAAVDGQMTSVEQRVYDGNGGSQNISNTPAPVILYEPNDTHDHWHLRNAARYSLWNDARTAEAAPGEKVGFCLLDSQRRETFGPTSAVYTFSGIAFCERQNPGATTVTMGISPGWRDVYGRSLAFQWVDISDVAPGRYWLRSEVDPDGVVAESNEANSGSFGNTASVVNGYLATPFKKQVVALLPSVITLPAQKFDDTWTGSPGRVQFRVDEAPKNGKLDRPVGHWFSGSVTYTPRFGFVGQDSFRFSARDSAGDFPRTPRSALAALGVGTAPAAVSDQSTSTALSWQSEPSAPPSSAAPRRAPDVGGPLPRPDGTPLAVPVVSVDGHDVLVRTVAWRAGTVGLVALHDGVRLGTCVATVPAGTPVTCRFDAPGTPTGHHATDGHHADVAATASLRVGGRLLASRAG
jgi:hypothetical protein